MKQIKNLLIIICLFFSSVSSASLILEFDPDFQVAANGDSVSVKLVASGLGDGSPISLGAFDLDVLFDDSVLGFTGYSVFDGLGDIGLVDVLDFSLGNYAPGAIGLSVTSLLPAADLDSNQPGSFDLAELFFSVDNLDAPSFTELSISVLALSDADGIDIFDFQTRVGIISTDARKDSIPEPPVLILMLLSLVALSYRRLKLK